MLPARLLVVTDRHGAKRPLTDTVRAVLDGGARWLWLRDKDLEPEARRTLALDLLALVRGAGGVLTIGGDPLLATGIAADGVHLGAGQSPAGGEARSRRLVGVSAHGIGDVHAAKAAGLDYVTLSPIHPTSSKPGYGPALGLVALRRASDVGIPVIALGGIGPGEARACLDAGAAGVAVMGGLMRSADPAAATRRLLARMEGAT